MTRSLAVSAVFFLVGCAGSPAWQNMQMSATRNAAELNNQRMMNMEIGQTKTDVVSVMGPAAKREAYRIGNEKTVEFLFYRTTGWSAVDSSDNDYHFTPIAFEDGKVVGWGRNYYDNIVRAAVDITIK